LPGLVLPGDLQQIQGGQQIRVRFMAGKVEVSPRRHGISRKRQRGLGKDFQQIQGGQQIRVWFMAGKVEVSPRKARNFTEGSGFEGVF